MPRSFPVYFTRAVPKPVGQSHVAVSQINRVRPPRFGRDRVLLGEDQAHDLAELHVLQEELDMNVVGWILGWTINFVFYEVIFRHHFDVGIIRVD